MKDISLHYTLLERIQDITLFKGCSLITESIKDKCHCTIKSVFKGHSDERTPSEHGRLSEKNAVLSSTC